VISSQRAERSPFGDRQRRVKGSRDQEDTGVTPEVEIWKPLPLARQVTPVTADSQLNGPTPVALP
jgi:hypothetical protein